MTEETNEILTLLDEDGQEHNFVVIDILNVNDRDYAILLPAEGTGEIADPDNETGEEGPEAIVFRIEEDEKGQTLTVVEDEQELDAVARAWEEAYDGECPDDEEDYEA